MQRKCVHTVKGVRKVAAGQAAYVHACEQMAWRLGCTRTAGSRLLPTMTCYGRLVIERLISASRRCSGSDSVRRRSRVRGQLGRMSGQDCPRRAWKRVGSTAASG
jgi:hypothetical protein